MSIMSIKFVTSVSVAAFDRRGALSCGPAQAQYADALWSPMAQQLRPQYPAEQNAPDQDAQLDPRLQRQIVNFPTPEAPGTVIVDTPNTYLYLVLGNGQAIRYGHRRRPRRFHLVGRQACRAQGRMAGLVSAVRHDRAPALSAADDRRRPRQSARRPRHVYRRHRISHSRHQRSDHHRKDVSSGCIRLTNEDVTDLYERVQVGAKIVVLPQTAPATVAQQQPRHARTALSNWASNSQAGLY